MNSIVNIDVDDLEKAVGFYTMAFGLRESRRLFGNTVAEMLGSSSRIYLLAKPPGSPAGSHVQQPRDYRRHWTPVHLDFLVDDIEPAVRRAVTAGARLEGQIQSFHWGRLATMSDPFGHGFCLLQMLGKSYSDLA